MKEYEYVTRTHLVRRTPVIIRVDGKAFHTFTKGMQKPFDMVLIKTMQDTMQYLCENIQNCVLGYTQSDEITLVLVDYKSQDHRRGSMTIFRKCAAFPLQWQRWRSTSFSFKMLKPAGRWVTNGTRLCSTAACSICPKKRYATALSGASRMQRAIPFSLLGKHIFLIVS